MSGIIIVHGGVGSKGRSPEDMNGVASKSMDEDVLKTVVNAVVSMEDDPRFNAGTGSVIRIDGSIQMDAAVAVPGSFGSVINIERVRNPVLVALDVMQKTPHIAIAGSGAVQFARRSGYPDYDPVTEKARVAYKKMVNDINDEANEEERYATIKRLIEEGLVEEPHDTVGAVAYINGKFAAAVSTGGASPMMPGRVGDVPLIGAGIYCGLNGAVVATGLGEEIAKKLLCYRIYSRIGEEPLNKILMEEIDNMEGKLAGVIAVSRKEYGFFSNGAMPVDSFEF